jgi:hypothetical protein
MKNEMSVKETCDAIEVKVLSLPYIDECMGVRCNSMLEGAYEVELRSKVPAADIRVEFEKKMRNAFPDIKFAFLFYKKIIPKT